MKFCWTTINVKNLGESLRFYQEIVGLAIDRRFPAGPGMEIVFLGDGETKVELIYNEKSKEVVLGKDISLGFEVKSLEDTMEAVKKMGIAIQGGPFQPNPHIKFFYVYDPNGLKIQFVENL
jgi:lactoylglutathione lyase